MKSKRTWIACGIGAIALLTLALVYSSQGSTEHPADQGAVTRPVVNTVYTVVRVDPVPMVPKVKITVEHPISKDHQSFLSDRAIAQVGDKVELIQIGYTERDSDHEPKRDYDIWKIVEKAKGPKVVSESAH